MIDELMLNELYDLLPLAALYAETHYRFRHFPFSLYYRQQPEIIFDAPLRLEPNQVLPIFLMIKDANKFPITVRSISITVSNGKKNIVKKLSLNENLNTPLWTQIIDIDVSEFPSGILTVDCILDINSNNKSVRVYNDNHVGLTHKPFSVLKADDPLPMLPGWYAGELHCHTSFGEDQIEFGAPLEFYQRASEAMGLSWVALTDHAYNLDDLPNNYLINDPKQAKWKMFLSEVERANLENPNVVLLPGEELTCRSSTGKNIHLLLVGQHNFLIGTGDDAQNWYNTRSEHSVSDAIRNIDPEAVAIAAHPLTPISFLEKILLNRNVWTNNDLNEHGLRGWQIWNGQLDRGFHTGLDLWKKNLNKGHKTLIFAGNDAHGNFNRYRQIRLPMISMRENYHHLFAKVTTRIKTGTEIYQESIINALKNGSCSLSNGPTLDLKVATNSRTAEIGEEVFAENNNEIQVEYLTTPEFGKIKELNLYGGGEDKEILLIKYSSSSDPNLPNWRGKLARPLLGKRYIRAELITEHKTGRLYHSFTNPIWLKN